MLSAGFCCVRSSTLPVGSHRSQCAPGCSDLSNNQLRGRLRWNWGQLTPNTGYVNLSGNQLSGTLPEAWYQEGGMPGINTLCAPSPFLSFPFLFFSFLFFSFLFISFLVFFYSGFGFIFGFIFPVQACLH